MNEFIEENKKQLVVAGIIVLITIVFSVARLFISSNNKVDLQKSIEELGSIYYENVYYPYLIDGNDSDTVEYLIDSFKEEGITVTLEELFNSITNANKEIFNSCDLDRSYVMIYPTGIKVNEYNLNGYLDCTK